MNNSQPNIERSALRQTLEALLTSVGLTAHFRVDDVGSWNCISERLAYFPVLYSGVIVDYLLEYWNGNGSCIEDISLVLYHDRRPCCIWPLSLAITNGAVVVGSGGDSVLPPLFVRDLPAKSVKSLTLACLDLLEKICGHYGVDVWKSVESYSGLSGISEWHDRAMQRGARVALQHEMFIDLSLDMSIIKSGLRKSYKSLITSGNKLWQVDVLAGDGRGVWNEFRELHLAIAGRATRSDSSWDLQYEAICHEAAFLVYLRDRDGRMVGGGFFETTHDEALYAVGAYDRNLFDKPLGHVVQYRAIEEMKARKIRWYKIGLRPYPADIPSPTAKELSIAEFKQGFATHILPCYTLQFDCNSFDSPVGAVV